MKRTNNTKTRIIAAILGIITVFSVTSVAATTSASAAEVPQQSMSQLEKDLREFKDMSLEKAIKMFEDKVPGGFLFTPTLRDLLGGLFEKQDSKPSIDSISADVNKLFDQIKSFENNMKKELNDVLDTKLFSYTAFHPMNSIIAGINNDMTSFKNGKYTDIQKLGKIAALIGSNNDWNKDNHALVKFATVTNELNNSNFLGKENMFQTIYNHFKSKVMLSGEAYDLAKPIADKIMKNYMAAYVVLMQSLTAQLRIAEMKDRSGIDQEDLRNICLDKPTIITRINYLNKNVFGTVKTVDGKEQLDNSNTVFKKYDDVFNKKNFDRLVLINKGNDDHRLTKASALYNGDVKASDWKDAADIFNKWVKDSKVMSRESVYALAKYANQKGKTIREFLTENGFDLKNVPKNAKLITYSATADEEVTVKSIFSAFIVRNWFHTEYKGVNIDVKNAKEENCRLWNSGYNLWNGSGMKKMESHPSSGLAACF